MDLCIHTYIEISIVDAKFYDLSTYRCGKYQHLQTICTPIQQMCRCIYTSVCINLLCVVVDCLVSIRSGVSLSLLSLSCVAYAHLWSDAMVVTLDGFGVCLEAQVMG